MKKTILILFLFLVASISCYALTDAEVSNVQSLIFKGDCDKALAILSKVPDSGKDNNYYLLKAYAQVLNENQDLDINNVNICVNKVIENAGGNVETLSHCYVIANDIDDITLKNSVASEIEKIKDVSPEKEKYVLSFYLLADKRTTYRDDMDGESTLLCAIDDLKYSVDKFEKLWVKGIEKNPKPDARFIIDSIPISMKGDLKLKVIYKLLELYPDSSYIIHKQLKIMMESNSIDDKDFVSKCKEQIPVVNKLISKDKDNIVLKEMKIITLYLAAEYNDCVAYAKEVIANTTKNKTAYNDITCSYIKLNNIKQALYYMNRSTEIFGKQKTFTEDFKFAIWGIGDYYYGQKNFNDALAWYLKIENTASVSDKIGICYYSIAASYYKSNNYSAALKGYENAYNRGVLFDSMDYDRMGDCFYALKNYQSAVYYYDLAYSISSPRVPSYKVKSEKAAAAYMSGNK